MTRPGAVGTAVHPPTEGIRTLGKSSSSTGGLRGVAVALVLSLPAGGCFGYRLIRPEEIEVPSYEPRLVLIPERCDTLITRAATSGLEGMDPGEARMVNFCQTQQLVRAQEEEAVARKLEAHAETASFALRLTTVVVGATIALLAWVF